MKFILGKKLEMSQIFNQMGEVVPVTLVEAGPCSVVKVKTKDSKDKYGAVQLAFGKAKEKKVKRPQKGYFKRQKIEILPRYLREFRTKEPQEYEVGDIVKVGIFNQGDTIKVSGTSKGKGFQGVVKRHGFKGGPASHGQKHTLRAPGSIGSQFPQRVWKGKRMAGRMGTNRVTISGLKVARVDQENNILAVLGAIPGNFGALLEIRKTKEAPKKAPKQEDK